MQSNKENNENKMSFKEKWKDKRFRSFFYLGFWLFFAIIVVSAYRPEYNSQVESYQEKQTNLVNSSVMKNYSYTILDTKDSKINVITGKVYNEYNLFKINDIEYYYNGSVYQMLKPPVKMDNYDLGYIKITPKIINNMIGLSETVDTNKYKLSLVDFLTLYDASKLSSYDATLLQNKYIFIDVIKNKNLFSKVNFDITEFIKITEPTVVSDILTFNYTEINEIEDFTKEYEGQVQGL